MSNNTTKPPVNEGAKHPDIYSRSEELALAAIEASKNEDAKLPLQNQNPLHAFRNGFFAGCDWQYQQATPPPTPTKAEEQPETAIKAADKLYPTDLSININTRAVNYSKKEGFLFGSNWKEQQLTATLQQKEQRISDLTYNLHWQEQLVQQKYEEIKRLSETLGNIRLSALGIKDYACDINDNKLVQLINNVLNEGA